MKYDLVVIGGGTGGYTGAIRAAKLGKKVALIEERDLGGTCLNRGCIPTKALLHSAELYASRGEWAELGISADNVSVDESKIYERKDKTVAVLRGGIETLLKANGVDLYRCRGVIESEHSVYAGEELLETEFILLATGSVPAGYNPARPLKGIENALNSDDVLSKPVEGDSVIIMGAGVIALEFASYFSDMGKQVTVLAPGDRILKMMTREVSVQLTAVLKRRGVKILTGVTVKELGKDFAVIDTAKGEEKLFADAVIAAVGRNCNVGGIGLEKVGIEVGRSIKTDDDMYTGVAGIYACGDVIGRTQLAHYAAATAITAVESMYGLPHSMDLTVCPSCIYTQPEIASVGVKETDIPDARVGKFRMGANGKSLIEGVSNGFVKVVADADGKVVGAELFCVRATDMVGELALAISKGMTAEEAASVIHPHPTVMEAVGESLEDIYGLATHMAPKKTL